MSYTKEQVLEKAEQEGVRFICLTFCDIFGEKKNITLFINELPRAFESGIPLDASLISGFKLDAKIDLMVRPDPDTMTFLPDALTDPEDGKIMHMFCEIYYPDGKVFENDSRAILKKAVQEAEKKGYRFNFGPAMEFYLCTRSELKSEDGEPFDHAGYMASAPEDRCERIRREICRNLVQAGVQPEVAYHEDGPGQNKVKFRFSDPVSAADAVIVYKSVVKSVANQYDLHASFSPKPIDKEQGNSMHVNMSIMADDGIDRTPHIIAGILQKIDEMTLFLNPTKKSYKRLGHGNAPKYITWSAANRSTLIRIPAYGGYTRFELRSPDNGANPYLTFALLIYACLYGIQNKPVLQRETEEDLFAVDAKSLPKMKTLPLSFQEAVQAAKSSAFIREHLPEKLVNAYLSER